MIALVVGVLYLALCIGTMAALNLSLPVTVVIGVLLFICALHKARELAR
jgi:lipopolysaccharide export LptBFGC system permease protein LptF